MFTYYVNPNQKHPNYKKLWPRTEKCCGEKGTGWPRATYVVTQLQSEQFFNWLLLSELNLWDKQNHRQNTYLNTVILMQTIMYVHENMKIITNYPYKLNISGEL